MMSLFCSWIVTNHADFLIFTRQQLKHLKMGSIPSRTYRSRPGRTAACTCSSEAERRNERLIIRSYNRAEDLSDEESEPEPEPEPEGEGASTPPPPRPKSIFL